MKMMSVNSFQGGVEKGMTGSSFEAESIKEVGIEVDICDKVTIAELGIELEFEKNKESGKGELDRSTMSGLGVGDGIAKVTGSLSRK